MKFRRPVENEWSDSLMNENDKIIYVGKPEEIKRVIREDPRTNSLRTVILGKDFKFIRVSVRSYMGFLDTRESIAALEAVSQLSKKN